MGDLSDVKCALRSLLLTYKDGCPVHTLPGLYRSFMGGDIQFRQMGFSNMVDFLRHIPDVARFSRNRDGEDVVLGVATAATEHIQKMVQRQRNTRSKPTKFKRPVLKRASYAPWMPHPRAYRPGVKPAYTPAGPRRPGPMQPARLSASGSRSELSPPNHPQRGWTESQAATYTGGYVRNTARPAFATPYRVLHSVAQSSANLPPRLQKQTQAQSGPGISPIITNKSNPLYRIHVASVPQPGETVNVVITHIQDAHNFYVTPSPGSGGVSTINNIMREIQDRMKTYPSHSLYASIARPEETKGAYCLAQFSSDQLWYRAKIVHAYTSPQFEQVAVVNFIDFGNSEKTNVRSVRPITAEECRTPAQCFRCSLQAILPKQQAWTNECNKELQRLLDSKNVQMEIARIISDELCEVTLTVNGMNINEGLVTKGLARKKNLEPPTLVHPDESEEPVVHVSYFRSTTTVIVQYEKYLEDLNDMERLMEKRYLKSEYCPNEFVPIVGSLYAGITDDRSVSRVRVLSLRTARGIEGIVDGTAVAEVYLPDHGDVDVLDISCIRWLDDQFRLLPLQAVTVCLSGLEPYENNQNLLETMCKHEKLGLLDNFYQAVFEQSADSESHLRTVVLYDEAGNNMNESLLATLDDADLVQKLPEPGNAYQTGDVVLVTVVHLAADGVVSVRVPGEGERRYQLLEEYINDYINNEKLVKLATPRPGDVVVAQYEQEAADDAGSPVYRWYRARVLNVTLNDVSVQFLDFGNKETVARDKIRQPDIGSKLTALPYQHIDVRLANLPPEGGKWTPNAVEGLGEILHPDAKILLRVEDISADIPEVRLYTFTEEGDMYDVNMRMLENSELFISRIESPAEASPIPMETHLNRLSLEPQTEPQMEPQAPVPMKYYDRLPIPSYSSVCGVGEFQAVCVTKANSPTNFSCVPLDCFPELAKLLDAMTHYYNKTLRTIVSDIIPHQMYAALYNHQWFRVIVRDVFPDERKITACFVDFGDYHIIEYGDVAALTGDFRLHPLYSFRAQLGGIVHPKDIWAAETNRKFVQLVEGKNLFALILNEVDGVRVVDLVDTSDQSRIVDALAAANLVTLLS